MNGRPRIHAPWIAVLALAAGCAMPRHGDHESGEAADIAEATEPGASPDHVLSPDLLPTPFSAAEIRAGNPPGTARRFLVSVDGSVTLEHSTFLEHPAGLARFEQRSFDLTGAPVGDPTVGEAPWEELQAHASYPRAEATCTDTTCTTAAGLFDTWLYDWREPAHDGQAAARHRVWFAKKVPGPPVLYELVRDGELEFRMELLSFEPVR